MNVFNLYQQELPEVFTHGAKYKGLVNKLGKKFGSNLLGFRLETMAPKTFCCPYHWHTEEEELIIIIEGEAIVRVNGKFRKLQAGDAIYYGVGPEFVHQMYNASDKTLRFLALSNNSKTDVCYYPDSQKRNDGTSTQNGIEVDYYKGEEDPSVYWPAEVLRGHVE